MRDADLFGCGIKVQKRLANVLVDAALEIGNLIVDALEAAGKLLCLAVAVAIEDGEVDLALYEAGGLDAADAAADFSDVAIEAELWIVAGAAGTLLFDKALALAGQGKIIGAGLSADGNRAFRVEAAGGPGS